MTEGPLHRYFELPEDVKKVDFVHQIDRAASPERAEAILGAYVITPSIERNLGRAIESVRRGIEGGRSVFTWIHGSFGSGKSHFMNVLSLLLADRIGKNLFCLHVQCISRQATTVEEIVFGAAMEEIARRHPEAPAPSLFASQELVEIARRLREDLGEARFFGALTSSSFLKLGPGLSILADYLKGLGYEGVVLFLDELVLWLSTFQDPKHLALEAPKVSMLVEHGDYPPSLPYLTFAARQRDLSEMVGTLAVGRDEEVFSAQLSFWKDRFETISLEDKDLPRIIEKRVLKANPGERATIDEAFEAYKSAFATDFRKLNGERADADDFRRVYPFTPALVDVMVALSATLQHGRTALRELTHLLVRYLPDFELGCVVPVGDLFDVVVHGQVSDTAAIARLYEQARRIYEGELLPHVRRKNKTDTPARCQLLREDFDARLGCAGCAERACRAQTRIAKTVLLQGIVPNTPALKNLTAAALVYLNSGTLKSKVPNQETAMAAALVREWAGVTPAVHVKGDVNPEVRAVLDAIDVRRILDGCRDLGTVERQRVRVRDIVFAKMAVHKKDQMGRRTIAWRGRKWHVGVVFDAAHFANDNTLRPAEDEDMRVVIGAPFGDAGNGPREAEARIEEVIRGLSGREAERGLPTIAWLPAFVDEETQQALVDLTTLDALVELREQELANRVTWVSVSEMPRVRVALEQQRDIKRALVEDALERAYGVSRTFDASLAPGLAPARRAHLLRRDAGLTVPADGAFDRALSAVVQQALGIRAPRHPVFDKQPTKGRLSASLELIERLLATPERKVRLDKTEIEDLVAIAGAEHLGIVRVIEDQANFLGGILDQVDKNLANRTNPLSVGAVRAALDPDSVMELSIEVQDFLVLAYAKAAPHPLALSARGSAAPGLIGKLTDDLALVPVELPGQQMWQRARAAALLLGALSQRAPLSGALTGSTVPTPSRVEELVAAVKQKAATLGPSRLAELIAALGERQRMAGVSAAVEATPRGEVLAKLLELTSAAPASASTKDVVEALARVPWDPARAPAIVYMAGAERVEAILSVLGSPHLFAPIEVGRKLEADPARGQGAARAMEHVRAALTSDEDVEALRPALEREAARITQILVDGPASHALAPGTQRTLREAHEVDALVAELLAKLERGERLRVTIEILDREGE